MEYLKQYQKHLLVRRGHITAGYGLSMTSLAKN